MKKVWVLLFGFFSAGCSTPVVYSRPPAPVYYVEAPVSTSVSSYETPVPPAPPLPAPLQAPQQQPTGCSWSCQGPPPPPPSVQQGPSVYASASQPPASPSVVIWSSAPSAAPSIYPSDFSGGVGSVRMRLQFPVGGQSIPAPVSNPVSQSNDGGGYISPPPLNAGGSAGSGVIYSPPPTAVVVQNPPPVVQGSSGYEAYAFSYLSRTILPTGQTALGASPQIQESVEYTVPLATNVAWIDVSSSLGVLHLGAIKSTEELFVEVMPGDYYSIAWSKVENLCGNSHVSGLQYPDFGVGEPLVRLIRKRGDGSTYEDVRNVCRTSSGTAYAMHAKSGETISGVFLGFNMPQGISPPFGTGSIRVRFFRIIL